ncbi:DUF3579 domain-containing protein [Candidatus Persebacteraceae bacterium Df01]|jgi:hypothetical protein|uniref:DUF3579 domain-containing protein n=1 Tax=Candidatus Doriopsillibacter californiensis TaxID=2970740 RepID=A0ABT7QLD3_9GAMM|nr:DUF3579 domain-containing protein [Candidatus Persebacteraceae bacterium Df01]
MSQSIPSGTPVNEDDCYIIIKGQTTDGKKFRPSDWCDRLYSTLHALDPEEYDNCIQYVRLVNYSDGKCILVDTSLKASSNMLYNFFMRFVDSNNLVKAAISKSNWDDTRNN